MRLLGSKVVRLLAALLLGAEPASAQIPVGPVSAESQAASLPLPSTKNFPEPEAPVTPTEPRFAYVSVLVQGTPGPDTRVTCDGQALPIHSLGVPLELSPGRHAFQAFSAELESASVALELGPGAVETVMLTLTPPGTETEWRASGPTPAVAPRHGAGAGPDRDRGVAWGERPYLVTAWASLGVSALSLGVGTYWALSSASLANGDALYATCNPVGCSGVERARIRQLDDAAESSKTNRMLGAFAIGGVSLATAAVMFYIDGQSRATEQAVQLTPLLGPGYAGLRGSF